MFQEQVLGTRFVPILWRKGGEGTYPQLLDSLIQLSSYIYAPVIRFCMWRLTENVQQ
jgi:hypothetical protein